MKVHPVVFSGSAALVLLFVVLGAFFPAQVGELFAWLQSGIVERFGWFYIVAVAFFLVFVLWLLVSRHASVRLGRDDEKPAYGFGSWFAMLFSAGMGIGLLFFSVAEPVMHFSSPARPRAAGC